MARTSWPPGTPHVASVLGVAVHRLIAQLLSTERFPSLEALEAAVRSDRALRLPHIYGLAGRQRVLCALSRYFDRYAADPRWRLAGVEVPLPGNPLDLLFTHENGGVFADEIKSSAFAVMSARETVLTKARNQAAASAEAYGNAFVGVRVCLLAAPRAQSFVVAPNGEPRPLEGVFQ